MALSSYPSIQNPKRVRLLKAKRVLTTLLPGLTGRRYTLQIEESKDGQWYYRTLPVHGGRSRSTSETYTRYRTCLRFATLDAIDSGRKLVLVEYR